MNRSYKVSWDDYYGLWAIHVHCLNSENVVSTYVIDYVSDYDRAVRMTIESRAWEILWDHYEALKIHEDKYS